jgi:FAD/FMN-containing dehydrogenase
MDPKQFTPEELDRLARALVETGKPTELFKVLLEGSRMASPRAAVFLIRQGRIKGWGCVGYGAEAARRLREHSSPADAGWLAEVAASEQPVSEAGAVSADLDFGQPPAAEVMGMTISVVNKPIAIIVIERSNGEEPWLPSLISLLVRVAQLRLDLDLVRRKLKSGEEARQQPVAETAQPAVELPTDPQDEQRMEAARRYARLLATDIRLYNEEAVVLGRKHGDLIDRLSTHLDRGKKTFLSRHGDLGPTGMQILHEAYVQVLAAGNDSLMPSTVLD